MMKLLEVQENSEQNDDFAVGRQTNTKLQKWYKSTVIIYQLIIIKSTEGTPPAA